MKKRAYFNIDSRLDPFLNKKYIISHNIDILVWNKFRKELWFALRTPIRDEMFKQLANGKCYKRKENG